MYSIVKQLRNRGVRRSLRDIQSDDGEVGHLTLVKVGHYRVLKLHGAGDDGQQNAIIPVLFDAVLTAMHGSRMMFSGFERLGNQSEDLAPAVMQEWSVEVMADQPDVPQASNRAGGLGR